MKLNLSYEVNFIKKSKLKVKKYRISSLIFNFSTQTKPCQKQLKAAINSHKSWTLVSVL